jgi:uncharacterized protein (DUF2164 family)
MKEIDRGLNLLSDKDRDRCIKEIISYFYDEKGETIGVIAAGNTLDFFLDTVGPGIYNKAIEDIKLLVRKEMEGFEVELDLLKRRV